MQLTPIAANQTEIETDNARVFFSYKTPVAAYVFGKGYVRTEQYWSVTTSRHIINQTKLNTFYSMIH